MMTFRTAMGCHGEFTLQRGYARGWDGNRLVFTEPPVHVLDKEVVLRQTLGKRSDREYRILNESGHHRPLSAHRDG